MLNYELASSTGAGTNQNVFQYQVQYSFGGLISLNTKNDQKNQFTNVNIVDVLIACKGSKCTGGCISRKECIGSQGILSSNNQTCLL